LIDQQTYVRHLEDVRAITYKVLSDLSQFPSESTPLTEKERELLQHPIPIVLASAKRFGIPRILSSYCEDHEEIYPGSLKLGEDLTHVFTCPEFIDDVKSILHKQELQNKIKVLSLEVLKTTQNMDDFLAPYFYDVFSGNKLMKMYS
jgi:hypothetical protein